MNTAEPPSLASDGVGAEELPVEVLGLTHVID
ncbi:MAG: hypothetical protein UY72_C0064G0004 [Candidatus Uhrbacteria bacterium GW2011_GWD2_52_7]|uniref:Uncharacterized protein n=1 Tax=Candidatus Uhrbacteria bacterium GW2011_GWD2_52_7 TaxID=1618989 RepID=A0A0G1XCK1_9BACT|nr:MAG: hypothetical protein UY72_C0064G0004 [Candidatus Uhrbacteria bacterium GW2011_GWD2_52_7]